MHKRSLLLSAAIAFLCAAPHFAQAQFNMPSQRTIRIGFGGGLSVPVGDVESALDNGINGQAFVLANLLGMPLRFNLGYQKLDFKELIQSASATTQILSGVGGIKLDLIGGPIRPYVTAGVGAFNIMTEVTGSDNESEFKFGIDGGAGIAINIGRLEGFIEGRVQNIYTDQGAIDFKSIRVIPVTLGILF